MVNLPSWQVVGQFCSSIEFLAVSIQKFWAVNLPQQSLIPSQTFDFGIQLHSQSHFTSSGKQSVSYSTSGQSEKKVTSCEEIYEKKTFCRYNCLDL